MATLLQDLRFALRMLVKNPGFTAVAVLTLALGIGANTAIFTVIDGLMLQKLHVPEPERLVSLVQVLPQGRTSTRFSYQAFERFRDHNHVFSGMFATDGAPITAKIAGQPAEMLNAEFESGSYYSVLGVNAFLGRTFTPEDDVRQSPVVVISYRYWLRRFSADPTTIGKTVEIKRIPFTIIGVTPPDFAGMDVWGAPDIAIPLSWRNHFRLNDSGISEPEISARLKRGVTEERALAEVNVIYQQILRNTPERLLGGQQGLGTIRLAAADKGWMDGRRMEYSFQLSRLMGAAVLGLLIACANLANLLLARAFVRRKEIAVRLAVGASRWRLIRQLLTESILMSIIGGALGLILAFWSVKLLLAILSIELAPKPDFRVLGFTTILSLFTGVLFGLFPAFGATRVGLGPLTKENAGGLHLRFGRFLVVGQVALSLPLLIGAGLLVHSLEKLSAIDPGFDQRNVLLFWVYPTTIGYDGAREIHLYEDLLEKFKNVRGVIRASLARHNLMQGGYEPLKVFVQGKAGAWTEVIDAAGNAVAPGFFETMGIPLLLGRDFSSADRTNTPRVAIVTQFIAQKCFPNENPIGRYIRLEGALTAEQIEIVGVVRDTRYYSLRQEPTEPRGQAFIPFVQAPREWLGQMTFELRTAGDPERILPDVRHEAEVVEGRLPVIDVTTQTEEVKASVSGERSMTKLIGFFGLLALLLASVGLYGVMAYTVVRRTNEIGIRMALGAERKDVLKLVVGQGFRLVVVGAGIGIVGALALTRFISSLLYGVKLTDPVTFVAVSLLLTGIALLASYIPARRATKVDPMVALRYE